MKAMVKVLFYLHTKFPVEPEENVCPKEVSQQSGEELISNKYERQLQESLLNQWESYL